MKYPAMWKVALTIFFFLIVISFSPIVIPENVFKPLFFGLPRTLWMGITISFLIFIDIILAAWASQSINEE